MVAPRVMAQRALLQGTLGSEPPSGISAQSSCVLEITLLFPILLKVPLWTFPNIHRSRDNGSMVSQLLGELASQWPVFHPSLSTPSWTVFSHFPDTV